MANSKKPKVFKIGIIAEDSSDVEVFKRIIVKYIPDNRFSTQKFVGSGCGKIKSKCGVWTKSLISSGCDFVVVVHDLDRNAEVSLRKLLVGMIDAAYKDVAIVVIPTEELEAWLLSDIEAVRKVFSIKKPIKQPKGCESIISPKEYLRDLVRSSERKVYVNAIHNVRIAENMCVSKLRNCVSFKSLDVFFRQKLLGEKSAVVA